MSKLIFLSYFFWSFYFLLACFIVVCYPFTELYYLHSLSFVCAKFLVNFCLCQILLFSFACAKFCNLSFNTWQFNSAKTIFAFSCPPQIRRRAKLFMSCCRPYLVHQYTISPFPYLHLPGEIFTCKGVKS